MWRQIKETLKNPLVRMSLLLGLLGAPPLWYSGVYIGAGRELIGGLLFALYMIIVTLDAMVTLTLLIRR